MTDDERTTMISIGKAVTEQGEAIKKILAVIEPKAAPVPSTFAPQRMSVVDHEGTLNRFKMEMKFEGGEMMNEQQRMDHSIRLLTEMEELLGEYGVTRLSGNYERTAKPISA